MYAAALLREGKHDESNVEIAHGTLWEITERCRRIERRSCAFPPTNCENDVELVAPSEDVANPWTTARENTVRR